MFVVAVLTVAMIDIKAITATSADPVGYEKISPNGFVSKTIIGPIHWMYSTTLEACASTCSADSSCFGFDWNGVLENCKFESVDYYQAVEGGYWNTRPDLDWVFYSKIWSTSSTATSTSTVTAWEAESHGYEQISPNGFVSNAGVLRRMDSATLEACASVCSADSSCFGFDWNGVQESCQLEPVDYYQAVESGHWSTRPDLDWVFYSKTWLTSTSTSSTSSTSTTATPHPCLDFCDSMNNTKIGQTCESISTRADCRKSFLGDGETVNACIWLNSDICAPPASSTALACSESIFSSCSCVSTSGWSNMRCRNRCHSTAQGSFHSKCSTKCSNGCDANAWRLEATGAGHSSLRGYQVVV
mmetsp:Transcript_67881/g.126840  ORF Transcript_67881/g.126840 Transcript_67881/m.126840 type:complete len:358 (-) Transcript_67881:103-1176(-)